MRKENKKSIQDLDREELEMGFSTICGINLNKAGYHIVLIGHENHPEVIGTMGQLPKGSIDLVQSETDAKKYKTDNLAWLAAEWFAGPGELGG